jgi:hypothetical protein
VYNGAERVRRRAIRAPTDGRPDWFACGANTHHTHSRRHPARSAGFRIFRRSGASIHGLNRHRSNHNRRPTLLGALLAAASLILAADTAAGHEVPGSVTVQVLVRHQDDRLQVLVRTPLEAMQEMQFPVDYRGILDLEELRASGLLAEAANRWITPNLDLYAGREKLRPATVQAVRLSIPSDRSFTDFDSAFAHVRGPPLPATTQLVWRQALLDVHLETPLGAWSTAERPRFSIDPRFGRLGIRVLTVIRYESPDGDSRVLQLAAEPGRVRLDPNWAQVGVHFVAMGFEHILTGLDHLLFLVCLVAPLRRLRQLVLVVTSFTVAHSITLIASAAGLAPRALWFPTLVEVLIALSIVYMAFENILGVGQDRRWTAAFGFGLIHGFGFSFALSESLQFAGSHLVTSLLAFNVGVELGQLLLLLLLIPLMDFIFRRLPNERLGVILVSTLIVHTAWHWTGERGADLLPHRPLAPLLEAVPEGALPWVLVVAAAVLPAWQWLRRRRSPTAENSDTQTTREPETGRI